MEFQIDYSVSHHIPKQCHTLYIDICTYYAYIELQNLINLLN